MEETLILQLVDAFGISAYYAFLGLAGLGLLVFIASIVAPLTKTKIDDELVTYTLQYKELFFRLLAKFAITNRKEKK